MNTPRSELKGVGMATRTRTVHFVGIGGIGMCGLAEVLLSLGYQVQGSDQKSGPVTARLAGLGAKVFTGHAAEQVEGADVVVVSSAIPADNPELRHARAQRIPVIRRAEMLAELMRLKYGIAIGGTHGKTTTTSLVAAILYHSGLDPTVVVGGKLNHLGTTARLGEGPYMVAEADESDGSFLHLSPTIAVVTNIDAEHMETYGDMDALRQAFCDFINRVPFYGLGVVCIDHPELQLLLPRIERRVITYGLSERADVQAQGLVFEGPSTRFQLVRRGEPGPEVNLSMLGVHNVQNALAALAISAELGIDDQLAAEALSKFAGVERRFTVRGEARGALVVDDYGHHPVELKATLDGARLAYPDRRQVVLFQPHRYSRTRDLIEDFARAFDAADRLFITPIYAAGEAPIPGVSAEAIAERVRRHGAVQVDVVDSVEAGIEAVVNQEESGDLILAFGAGDIGRAGQEILRRLGELEGP